MSAASDYLEDAVLEYFFRNDADTFSPVATLYLALFTTDPSDDASGTEVTGGSYARQAIAFDAASGGSISNSSLITFSGMPAATVTHWAIFDASTGGNMYAHEEWDSARTYSASDDATVAAGAVTITQS